MTQSLKADLFREKARAVTDLRRSQQQYKRCPNCWLDIKESCICDSITQARLSDHIRLIVYMDYKEYYNPGDDGKLLLCTMPNITKLFLYPHMDEELIEFLASQSSSNTIVLFPCSTAISVDDWKLQCCEGITEGNACLNIIVIDAVWRNARKMALRLNELLPQVKHIQLSPESLSVYARTQSQSDRICTVEATSLFLTQLGENEEECRKLIDAVILNNGALKRKK